MKTTKQQPLPIPNKSGSFLRSKAPSKSGWCAGSSLPFGKGWGFKSRLIRGWASILSIMLLTPLLFLGEGLGVRCSAQNVGISATGVNPDNSAMLDVTSNTKGMLIPRMTGDEKYAIPSPATGLLIFQTDTVGFWYYEGTKWIPLLSSTSSTGASTGGWGLSGNGSTNASNFLGTTDNVSLRMRTNNTEKMIVDSLGRVGINKTNPAYKLDIYDANSVGNGVTSATLNLFQTRTEPNITSWTNAYGINNKLLYRMTEASPLFGVGIAAVNTIYTDGAYTFNALRGVSNIAYTNSTATTNQNWMDGAGNFGYLNSSGTVGGVCGSDNQVYNNSSGTITAAHASYNVTQVQPSATGTITNAYGTLNWVQNMSTAGGSIGTAYGVASYIRKAAAASVIPTGYLYYGAYLAAGDVTTPWGIYLTGEDKNYFSGKVGIGTTSPKAGLQVGTTGTLISPVPSGQGTTLGFNVYNDAGTYKAITTGNRSAYWDLNNSRLYLKYTSGTQTADVALSTVMNIMAVDNGTGNVGINCDNPQYKLHVIGDIASSATIRGVNAYVTGAITACSDIRYKKDITPLSHALDKVLSMQGVNYHWKTKEFPEKQFTEVQQIGFIAQELEKIVPEVVMTDKDGYKSVDYSRLTPVLVEAIKELKAENDSLKTVIGNQSSAIDKQQTQLLIINNQLSIINAQLGVKAEK